ncbi:MAG: ABC transporter permease [Acidobacteriota bacterium]
MQTFWQDVRYGLRVLRRNSALSAVAVIALALGIGANSAIFSVVNAVLLRPLPYRDADRIVAIQEIGKDGSRRLVTPANFLDWRAQNTVFEHLAAILTRTSNLAGANDAERINLAITSANFFEIFGIRAQQGRLFVPDDEQAGHAPIAVISDALWQRRFGGVELVGNSITLDGKSYTVAGIAPAGFQYPDKTDVWLPPLRLAPAINDQMDVTRVRGFGFLSTVGLLKPGVPLSQAKSEMEVITARLREQYPETNNNRFNRVVSLHTYLVGDTSNVLWLLLGAVCFVLLIACANVANLLLARATSRQKEMAIRAALGASRLRVIRQLLTESSMLALLGGALGLLLALWGIDVMTTLLPKDFPRLQDINLDYAVLGFTLLVSLLTGIVFGLAPALQVSTTDIHESLKESSRGTSGGGRRNRLRNLLVVSEVALCFVLLIGAGLLFRSFLELQSVNKGFNSQRVLTMRLSPSGARFTEDAQYISFYRQAIERISAIGGVDSVGMINTLPLSKGPTTGIRIEGRPQVPPDQWPGVNYRNVSPDYFRAMDIPIVQGRALTERDNVSVPLVVLINQVAAERDFAGENPIGKRINMGGSNNGQPIWFEIVGVVANVRNIELNTEPLPDIYTSYMQDPFAGMSFVIRTALEPASLAAAVRESVQEVDREQPVAEIRSMENIVTDAVTQPRFNLVLLGIFGSIALILSAAGIYGVMSYSVTQRTPEIGIRMALGAKASDVLKMVVGQGMILVAIGIVVGLIASFALTHLMTSLLYGVSATDPITFLGISILLAGVALGACFVPARRAAKVDPLVALRYE